MEKPNSLVEKRATRERRKKERKECSNLSKIMNSITLLSLKRIIKKKDNYTVKNIWSLFSEKIKICLGSNKKNILGQS